MENNNENTTYSKTVIEISDFIFKNPDKDNINDVLAEFGGKWRRKKRTFERM